MRKPFGLVILAAMAFAGLSAAGDPMKDLALLQGNWKVASIKESEKDKAPPDEVVKSLGVNITGDLMKLTMKKDGKEEQVMSFKLKLDPSKNPKQIDFLHEEGPTKGKSDLGIYKIEGNTVTFCNEDAGKPRPTAFATKAGTTTSVIVIQKVK
jgi:uncharacterized protein (TIGR03067 family)